MKEIKQKKEISEKGNGEKAVSQLDKSIDRRDFLKETAIGVVGCAAGLTMNSIGPFVRTAKAATLELKWLGWEVYDDREMTAEFEKKYNCKISAGFFDGNSEAFNKLRLGGAKEFDIVQGDGFWPRMYLKKGLVQPVDYKKIPNLKNTFPDFLPPKFTTFVSENGTDIAAVPLCWGGYGIAMNLDKIKAEDQDTLMVLYDPKYKGKISVSKRFEENIALTAIIVCQKLGTINKPRPDGKPFNPYVLTDEELEEIKKMLIEQKKYLLLRWSDTDTLERLLRAEAVWAAPEWGTACQKIQKEYIDGKTKLNFKYLLNPKEGGLGWVDTDMITSGVVDSEKLELCYKWINFRRSLKSMSRINLIKGVPTTIDTREVVPAKYHDIYFMNQTKDIHNLYMFDKPSNPEKWERIWSQVEAG